MLELLVHLLSVATVALMYIWVWYVVRAVTWIVTLGSGADEHNPPKVIPAWIRKLGASRR